MNPPNHGSLQFHERCQPILDELVREANKVSPVSWRRVSLRLVANWNPVTRARSIAHRLQNPEDGMESQSFTPTLFEFSEQLHQVFADSGAVWTTAELCIHRNSDGRVASSETNYQY